MVLQVDDLSRTTRAIAWTQAQLRKATFSVVRGTHSSPRLVEGGGTISWIQSGDLPVEPQELSLPKLLGDISPGLEEYPSRVLVKGVSGRQERNGCEAPDDIHGDQKITHADSLSFGISTVPCR